MQDIPKMQFPHHTTTTDHHHNDTNTTQYVDAIHKAYQTEIPQFKHIDDIKGYIPISHQLYDITEEPTKNPLLQHWQHKYEKTTTTQVTLPQHCSTADTKHPQKTPIKYKCNCGFTAGTEAALQKHITRAGPNHHQDNKYATTSHYIYGNQSDAPNDTKTKHKRDLRTQSNSSQNNHIISHHYPINTTITTAHPPTLQKVTDNNIYGFFRIFLLIFTVFFRIFRTFYQHSLAGLRAHPDEYGWCPDPDGSYPDGIWARQRGLVKKCEKCEKCEKSCKNQ